jgi:ATP-dependent exoDNAse (exonuclease V) beta subunit
LKQSDDSIILEEEKRLCYVAMTRAKTELVMTWRREVPIFTSQGIRSIPSTRSRFLDVLMESKDKGSTEARRQFSNQSVDVKGPSKAHGTVSRNPLMGSPEKRSYRSSPSAYIPKTTTKKFEGTASVYARTTSPYENTPVPTTKSKSPRVMTGASNPVATTKSSYRVEESRRPYGVTAVTKQTVTQKKPEAKAVTARKSDTPRKADSTWFFPVGTAVVHNKLGRGVVLPPKSDIARNEMLVHIEFTNGDKHEFPVHGPELSPIVER